MTSLHTHLFIMKKRNIDNDTYAGLVNKKPDEKLSLDQLACALYEGSPHLQNLAEKLARQHGKAQALSFYTMMGKDVQNFWKGIAKQLIDHAAEWQANEGSCCVLSQKETDRLKAMPRIS